MPSAPSLLREDSAWAKTRSGGARLLSGSPRPPASCRRLAVGGQVSTLRRHQLAARGAGSAASQGGTHPGPPPPAGSRGRTGSRRAPTRVCPGTRTGSGAQQDTGASTHPCSQRRRVRTRTAHTRRPCLYTQPRPERGRPRGDPSVTTRPHRSPRPLRAWQLGPALPFPRFFHGPFRRQRLSQHFRLVYRAVREHFVSAPAFQKDREHARLCTGPAELGASSSPSFLKGQLGSPLEQGAGGLDRGQPASLLPPPAPWLLVPQHGGSPRK